MFEPFHSLFILQTVYHTIHMMLYLHCLENLVLDQLIISQFDIFIYSHLLSAWYCIDTVRRNSVSVTQYMFLGGALEYPCYSLFSGVKMGISALLMKADEMQGRRGEGAKLVMD